MLKKIHTMIINTIKIFFYEESYIDQELRCLMSEDNIRVFKNKYRKIM